MPRTRARFFLPLLAGVLSLAAPEPGWAQTGPGYGAPKAGITMSADELRDLYAFVPLDERTLLTLSRARNGRLVFGRLNPQGVFNALLTLEEDTSTLVRSPADVELGIHSTGPNGTVRILLLYRLDTSSPYRVKREVWLQTLSLDAAGKLSAPAAEKVAETAYETKGQDPKSPWWFDWPSPNDPAPASEVRLFVRDVNGDGNPDLVLWSKRCLSKPKSAPVDGKGPGETCPRGFRFDRWDSSVKLATRDGWGAGALGTTTGLDRPSAELWDKGLGAAIFRSSE